MGAFRRRGEVPPRDCRIPRLTSGWRALSGAAILVAAILALAGGASAEPTCTDTWTGTAGDGLWQTAGNWSTASVPDSSDVVCIGSGTTVKIKEGSNTAGSLQDEGSLEITGGSLELTDSSTMSSVKSLVLDGGTLTGAGSVTVSGTFSLGAYSTMSGSGETVVGSGVSGTIEAPTGCEPMSFDERAFVNEGTLTFGWGTLLFSGGAWFENKGTFVDNSREVCEPYPIGPLVKSDGDTQSFINAGTFETEGSTVGIGFDNEGVVKAQKGALEFTSGGVPEEVADGSWNIEEGGSLVFAEGTFWIGEAVDLSAVEVTGATVVRKPTGEALRGALEPLPYASGTVTVSGHGRSTGSALAGATIEVTPAGKGEWETLCGPLTPDGVGRFNCMWATKSESYPDGSYQLRAKLSDSSTPPDTAQTSPITVVVDNTPPTGTLASLASSISGTVTLEGEASDSGSGVATWTPQITTAGASEWTNACSAQSTPVSGTTYRCSLDTTEYPSSSYEFRAVIVDNAGNTYTTSAMSAAIDNPDTTSELSFSLQFGSEGSGDGQFVHPADVAIGSDGNVWVVDQDNDRVEEFNEKGEYLSQFGSEGSGDGQFIEPEGIAVDAEGDIWVLDSGNSRVQEFSEKGEHLKTIGSEGIGAGQFEYPAGIAVDSHGNVWVSDTYNSRVEEFNRAGEYVKTVGTEGSGDELLKEPSSLAVDSHGNVWVVEWADSVVEYNEKGEYLRRFGSEGRGNGKFRTPFGIAVDPSGNVWVGDLLNGRIEEFNDKGEYVSQFGTQGTGEWQFKFNYPMGLAFSESGAIWIADSGNNRVEEWVPAASAPSNTAVPSVTGAPYAEVTLNASSGTWIGSPRPSYGYQWQRCNTGGGECVNITDATSHEYILGESDIGKTVRVVVIAENSNGSATASSSPTATIGAATAPSNATLPTISGTAQDGHTLAASTGTWTGDPPTSYSYQWQTCNSSGESCTNISGATGTAYTLDSSDVGDTVRSVVSAKNSAGSTSATSEPSAVVVGLPVVTSAPSISGTATAGQTLTASTGAWTGTTPISYTYQWKSCNEHGEDCADIMGATESKYELGTGDVGTTLRVVATADNAVGSASSTSEATAVVAPLSPSNTVAPSISGVAQYDETLTASTGTWVGTPTLAYTYQWLRCNESGGECADIAGATSGSYVLSHADVGMKVKVDVTATNTGGSAGAYSGLTAVVAPVTPPSNTTPPVISGETVDGYTLSANNGTWAGTTPLSYTYQWQSCNEHGEECANITGATGSSDVLGTGDIGTTLKVRVTATNMEGSASADSSTSAVIAPATPPSNTTLPSISGLDFDEQTLTANDGTWSGSVPMSYSYQWERCNAGPIGHEGSGSGELFQPTGITVDALGDIWVADDSNDRIEEFNAAGEYMRVVGAPRPKHDERPFTQPEDVAVDEEGEVWVADLSDGQLVRLNAVGEEMSRFYTFGHGEAPLIYPYWVAPNEHGDIWTEGVHGDEVFVQEYTHSGEYLRNIEAEVPGQGEIGRVLGMVVHNGDVWLVDESHSTVDEFDEEGRFIKQVGSQGGGPGQFTYPQGIAVDSAGDVWVGDGEDHRIEEFDEDGEYIGQIDLEVAGVEGVTGLAINPAGNILVLSPKGDIYEFTTTGQYIENKTCIDIPGATGDGYPLTQQDTTKAVRVNVTAHNVGGEATVTSRPSGVVSPLVLPADTALPIVSGIDEQGQALSATEGEWRGSSPLYFSYQWQRCNTSGGECVNISEALNETYVPQSADVGSKLRVQVTGVNPEASATATSMTTSVISAAARPINTSVPTVTGTAKDGKVLTASPGTWTGGLPIAYSYQWQACNSSGAECKAIEDAIEKKYQLTTGEIGDILRVVVTASNTVGSTSATSSASSVITAGVPVSHEAPAIFGIPQPGKPLSASTGTWAGTTPLSYAYQWQRCTGGTVGANGANGEPVSGELVAVGARGDIWIVDKFDNRVEEFSPNGEYLRSVTEALGASPFGSPAGIAAARKGGVWIADAENNSLEEFTESGDYVRRFGSEGSGPGQFDGPTGLSVNDEGDIWVIDRENYRIQEFTESGEYLRQTGSEGTGHGEFDYPENVAVDSVGDVWVLDGDNLTIQEFNQHGEYVDGFASPFGGSNIAVDSSDHIWLANSYTHKIEEFSETGGKLGEFALEGEGKPSGLAFDSSGDLWLTNNGRPERYALDGDELTRATWGECSSIEGATNSEYTLTEADLGFDLRVLVTASNTSGSTQASSATSPEVEPGTPSKLEAPSISGTLQAGQTLSTSTGSWSATGPLSYTYQWESCNESGAECAPIEGATESEYPLGEGDVSSTLRVVVTATDSLGSTSGTSSATSVVQAEPTSEIEAPSISGTPDSGEVLDAHPGAWRGTATQLRYQWESCSEEGTECEPIQGAIDPEYQLGEGDVGTTLRIRVGAGNTVDSLTDVSQTTPAIGTSTTLQNIGLPSISGRLENGGPLLAETGLWSQGAGLTYTYQWEKCDMYGIECNDIEGATANSYTPGPGEVGDGLRVKVDASSMTESKAQASTLTQPVAAASTPVIEEEPTVAGTALVGDTLGTSVGVWSREGPTTYSYQWERCGTEHCTAIEGATTNTYVLTESDLNDTLRALVTATGGAGNSTAVSSPTAAIEPQAIVKLSDPTIYGAVQVGSSLSADPGIWSGAALTYAYQWESCNTSGSECASIEGAHEPAYTIGSGDVGKTLRVKVTVTGSLGSESAVSAAGAVVPGGEVSVEEAIDAAKHADPSLLEPSTSTTLEEHSIAPSLSDGEEGLSSASTLTSSSVSKETPGEFAVNTFEGMLSLTPIEVSPKATQLPTIVNGAAAFFANTWPATDTIVRPDALGATTLLQLRSAEAPTSFSWEVHLGANQQLQRLPDGAIAVVDHTEPPPESSEGESEEESEAEAKEKAEVEAREKVEEEVKEKEEEAEGRGKSEGSETESEEEVESEAPEEEETGQEEVSLEGLPSAPTLSTEPAEAITGQPQPQQTHAQYESDLSALATAESETSEDTLMVIEPPTVTDANGHSVSATLTTSNNTITLHIATNQETTYPVIADPSIAAPTDTASNARAAKYNYGISDQNPENFERSGANPETFTSLDPHLISGPLHASTARLIIPYNLLSKGTTNVLPPEEQQEEQQRLTSWLNDVSREHGPNGKPLEPYITFEIPKCSFEESCKTNPPPTPEQYEAAIKPIVASLARGHGENGLPAVQVMYWGATNEPDYGPATAEPLKKGESISPLQKYPGKAAELWKTAQSVVHSYCGNCIVVAGEFQEDNGINHENYIRAYKNEIIKLTRGKCTTRQCKPEAWGLHDYHDIVHETKHAVNEFTKRIVTQQLSYPHVWISEAGVELQNNKSRTHLDDPEKSKTENRKDQRKAAFNFLHLHEASKHIERLYYYSYRQPTESERAKKKKPHLFDSGLVEAEHENEVHFGSRKEAKLDKSNGMERPAYCVLAYTKHICAPTVMTGPHASGGSGTCSIHEEASATVTGRLDPNGQPTRYWFEAGGWRTLVRSAGSGYGVEKVSARVEVAGCGTESFRLVAESPGGKVTGANSMLTFGRDVGS
jgi:sugar lactone lactonase YvrE